jgi:molybdopterin-guanine dinucleotide biosynthesis protein B
MTLCPIVAVVGNSNSGKTTVAADLIAILTSRGYEVAAVKHCPHGHEGQRADSDTQRLYKAGAKTVLAASPDRHTQVSRRSSDEPFNSAVRPLLGGVDLVIAEGYKESEAPKVLVLDENGDAPEVKNVIAVVSRNGTESDVPCFAAGSLEGLADLVDRLCIGAEADGPGVTLVVDGKDVELTGFVGRILARTVQGIVGELKNVPDAPGEIQLIVRNGKSERS